MQDFRNLQVCQKAHSVTLEVYRLTAFFPKEEMYGLTVQMRRSAASVGYNIAEGCGAGADADFAQFLQMAMRSACELEYQLLLSKDLRYLTEADHEKLQGQAAEVKRMLVAFIGKLKGDKE